MSTTNRFLSSSQDTHTGATEKTLLDIDEALQSGLTVSGTVSVSNFPATQNVSEQDANFSGAMTNLSTGQVDVSIDVANQTGNLNVDIAEQSLANVSANLNQVGGSAVLSVAIPIVFAVISTF